MRKNVLFLAGGVLLTGGVFFFLQRFYRVEWLPPCPLYTYTGLYCAGCGANRAFYALLHGDLIECFRLNPLLIPAVFTIAAVCIKPNIAAKMWFYLVVGAVIIAYAILRNLPAFL
jgi:hypothetical protein